MRRLDLDFVMLCQINCRMIRKRQWFHMKSRSLYERWLNGEGEGQQDLVEPDALMETAARRLHETLTLCEILHGVETLIVWGYQNNLQVNDLYTCRVDCYHDDDYWKGCCHLEDCCNAPLE